MNESSVRTVVTTVIGVLLVAGAGALRLGEWTPLATPKQVSGDSFESRALPREDELEKIDARLWEDPHEAYLDELRDFAAAKDLREKAFGKDSATKQTHRGPDSETDPVLRLHTAPQHIASWLEQRLQPTYVEVRASCRVALERSPPPRPYELAPACRPDAPGGAARLALLLTSPTIDAAGNAELRRQMRVALQTTMRDRGWASRDESAIGVMQVPRERDSCKSVRGRDGLYLSVYFETFTHPTGAKAVALWVDEEDIASARALQEISRCLADVLTSPPSFRARSGSASKSATNSPSDASRRGNGLTNPQGISLSLSVIGPSKSSVLLKWINAEELSAVAQSAPSATSPTSGGKVRSGDKYQSMDQRAHSRSPPIRLYSPASTIPESSLFALSDGQPGATWGTTASEIEPGSRPCISGPRTLSCFFSRFGFDFIRGVKTDDKLVELLTNEIGLRSLALKPRECNVIVVTEADSAYARWFKDEVQRQLPAGPGQTQNPHGPCTLLEAKSSQAIGTYQYLRAVNDSRAVDRRTDGRYRSDDGPRLYKDSQIADAGRQQFDYIERLAARIESDVLARRWDAEHVFAIGLFALDAHDKVSLLKALRGRFPHARFVTTDLDVTYLDPRHLKYTRNLIIASHYGLDSGDVGLGMPPFRRSMQVAYARSFASALVGREVQLPSTPGLYEVGLSGFIRLNPQSKDGTEGEVDSLDPKEHCGVVCALETKWDGLEDAQRVGAVFLMLSVLVAIGAVIIWLIGQTRIFVDACAYSRSRGCGQRSQRLGVISRAALIVAIVLATAYYWIMLLRAYGESANGSGEPLALVEGASLWAPVLIRGLAIAIGVISFIVFLGSERRTERAVAKKLGFFESRVTAADEWFRMRDLRRWATGELKPAALYHVLEFLPFGRPHGRPEPALAWRQFERRSCALGAVAVALGIAGYLLYLGCLSIMDDPTAPSRGENMAALNTFAVRLVGVVMFTLAFVVFLKQGLLRRFFEVTFRQSTEARRGTANEAEAVDERKLKAVLERNSMGDEELALMLSGGSVTRNEAPRDGNDGTAENDLDSRIEHLRKQVRGHTEMCKEDRVFLERVLEEYEEKKEISLLRSLEDEVLARSIQEWSGHRVSWAGGHHEGGSADGARPERAAAASTTDAGVEMERSWNSGPTDILTHRSNRDAIKGAVMLDLAEGLLARHMWPVYTPILMLSLIMLARVSLFENQTWPPVFWMFLALVLFLSLWNAVRTYLLAHAIRTSVIHELEIRRDLIPATERSDTKASSVPLKGLFDALIGRANAIQRGPFAPLAEQPFVLAFGIPLSGTVVVEILNVAMGLR